MVFADNRTVDPALHVHPHSTLKYSLDLDRISYLQARIYLSSIPSLCEPDSVFSILHKKLHLYFADNRFDTSCDSSSTSPKIGDTTNNNSSLTVFAIGSSPDHPTKVHRFRNGQQLQGRQSGYDWS